VHQALACGLLDRGRPLDDLRHRRAEMPDDHEPDAASRDDGDNEERERQGVRRAGRLAERDDAERDDERKQHGDEAVQLLDHRHVLKPGHQCFLSDRIRFRRHPKAHRRRSVVPPG
jgi:hypothetical protein